MVTKKAIGIAVAGAKGGVGATTIVVNLAALLAPEGSVLVIDADDVCQGDVAILLGMADSARTMGDISKNMDLGGALIQGYLGTAYDGVGLIQICRSRGESNINSLAQVIHNLSEIYSYILIDAGLLPSHVFPFVSRIVVATGPDVSSIVAAGSMIKSLRRNGIDGSQINLVMNNWLADAGFSRPAVEQKMEVKIDHFLPAVGMDMVRASVEGRPIVFADPSHPFSVSLREYATALADIDPEKVLGQRIIYDDGRLDNEAGNNRCIPSLKQRVLEELSSAKEIRKIIEGGSLCRESRSSLEQTITKAVNDILDKESCTAVGDRESFVKGVIDEAIGLGPLEQFMADPDVTEIMVNSKDQIYIERRGKITPVQAGFCSDKNLMAVIERIVSPIGRRVDESSPVVDARLSDGSRVHVIIPPLSLGGPTITIRKFSGSVFSMKDLITHGSLSEEMALFLNDCVTRRQNILVSGGTGSGKTTLLNILSSFIPENERIITIEDSAELKLHQLHVIRLESRPQNIEGRGEVTIRDLVRASLRMRPDRIVIGECRGAESLDMLQAMNTGHEGSLTTIHANSCRDSLSRLETLVLFAGFDLPVKAIREQIASAIDIVVQVKRLRDGSRKIVSISEISGLEGPIITMQELFSLEGSKFVSTGMRPRFMDDYSYQGV